jgi:hypothetical protein
VRPDAAIVNLLVLDSTANTFGPGKTSHKVRLPG